MKKLITAAALATVLVSPALAQAYNPDLGTGNIVPNPYAQEAQAPHGASHGSLAAHARVNRGVVMPDGAVAQDPDRNIRFELNREAEEGEW
jgi:hypothetical protein